MVSQMAEIKGIMEVQEADDVTRIQPVEKEEKEIQVVANIKDMVGYFLEAVARYPENIAIAHKNYH